MSTMADDEARSRHRRESSASRRPRASQSSRRRRTPRMNLDRFLRERGGSWNELDSLINEAGRRPEKLGAARVRRLGELYRATAADLALARSLWPAETVTARLEQRVGARTAPRLRRADPARLGPLVHHARLLARRRASGGCSSRSQRRSCSARRASAASGPTATRAPQPGSRRAAPTSRSRSAAARREPRASRRASAPRSRARSSRTTSRSRCSRSPRGITAGVGTALLLICNGVHARASSAGSRSEAATAASSSSSSPRTACSSCRASSSPAPPGCAWAGR